LTKRHNEQAAKIIRLEKRVLYYEELLKEKMKQNRPTENESELESEFQKIKKMQFSLTNEERDQL
jgi:hypothetical protein